MTGYAKEAIRTGFKPEKYKWWHAAIFGIAANFTSGLRTGRRKEDQEYYEELKQAPFAPPAWVFAPVWVTNNVSQLWGNLRLLNSPGDSPNRRELLTLQSTSWLLFSTFNYVYFKKRSPILGFLWTTTDWLLTIISVILGLKSGRRDIVLSLLTRLAWLTLATPVTAYQATKNPDPLLGYDPRGR